MRKQDHVASFSAFFLGSLFFFLTIPIGYILFFPSLARAVEVTLAWNPNSEPDLAGYRVYIRPADGSYGYDYADWDSGDDPGADPVATRCTISDLPLDSTWCFIARAYNTAGIESSNSNEVCHQLQGSQDSSPSAPSPSYGTMSERPVLISPADGTEFVSLTPELLVDADASTESGSHAKTQWQVMQASDDRCVFNLESADCLTALTIPEIILKENTRYYWKVRFYDSKGTATDWSDSHSFTTDFTGRYGEDGVPNDQRVGDHIDLDADGTADNLQDDIKSVFTEVGNGMMGVNFTSSNVKSLEAIETVDPAAIADTGGRPADMPLGLISFKLILEHPGETASITIHLSETAPAGAKWFKHDLQRGWQDYSAHANFSADGNSVTLLLEDGGAGDGDGAVNGIIIDPSGLVLPAAAPTQPDAADDTVVIAGGGSGGGGGGCFVTSASLVSCSGIRPPEMRWFVLAQKSVRQVAGEMGPVSVLLVLSLMTVAGIRGRNKKR